MFPKSSTEWRRVLVTGAIAGAAAGFALTVLMTATALATGSDPWVVVKGASAPFLGSQAVEPGFDLWALWLGLATHVGISILWAIPFAILATGLDRGATLAASAAWGLVVWLGMFLVILPLAGLGEMARAAPIAREILTHVFFGFAIGGALVSLREEEVREGGWFHEHAPAHA
jgi:hypothetical protein